MIYPALHYLFLVCVITVASTLPEPAVLIGVVATAEMALAAVLRRSARPKPGASLARALSTLSLLIHLGTLVAGTGSILGDGGEIGEIAFVTLVVIASLLLVVRLLLHSISRKLEDPELSSLTPALIAELVVLVSLLVPSSPALLAAAVVLLTTNALCSLFPFQSSRVSPPRLVMFMFLLISLVTIVVAAMSERDLIRLAVVASTGILLLSSLMLLWWAASAISFARTYGVSPGLLRSLLTYYGVPFRLGGMKRMYGRFVKTGSVVFDVGAHVGNRVVAFRALGARVVAVEPQPAFAELLRRLFAGDRKVTIEEVCLGPESGTVSLQISSRHPTLSTASAEWIVALTELDTRNRLSWDTTIERQQRTLGELRTRYGDPEFIKIDVEGFEAGVLEGLDHQVRGISIEFMPGAMDGTDAAVARMEELGRYHYNFSFGESMQLTQREALSAESLLARLHKLPAGTPSGDVYASSSATALRSSATAAPSSPL